MSQAPVRIRLTDRVRRRWWVLPIVVLLVAAALVLRALTAPLTVSASVANGDPQVARTAAIVFAFNQDMDAASVARGVRIDPSVPFGVIERTARVYEIHAQLRPDTAYQVRVDGARKATGFGSVTYGVNFHTEAAPRVTGAIFNNVPLQEGQQAVSLRGTLTVAFSQPMDSAHTPLLVDESPIDRTALQWDAQGLTLSLPLSLRPSRPHTLVVPESAFNRRHDPMTAPWRLSFTAMAQVPSQGSTAMIGASDAPIIIQIENSGQPTVRPQSGMQQADMVYEYISEYGIPRLTAVYWHPISDLVGPVRSCRLITIQLEEMYKGMIYCSGGNDYVLGKIWGANLPSLINDWSFGRGNVFFRTGNRIAPHNVMARGANATAWTAGMHLSALAYDVAPAHADEALPGGAPATTVTVAAHGAVWRYDAASQQYLKWQDGTPFRNVGTGQVHAKTVIVEHVTSFLDVDPRNTFHGYHTEYYELAGDGPADIYSDGMMIHGTWHHPDRNSPTVYTDAGGNPIDLNTGLTWVHVVGTNQ